MGNASVNGQEVIKHMKNLGKTGTSVLQVIPLIILAKLYTHVLCNHYTQTPGDLFLSLYLSFFFLTQSSELLFSHSSDILYTCISISARGFPVTVGLIVVTAAVKANKLPAVKTQYQQNKMNKDVQRSAAFRAPPHLHGRDASGPRVCGGPF